MILELLQKIFSESYQFDRIISSPTVRYQGIACFSLLAGNQVQYIEEGQYTLGKGLQFAYQKRSFQLHENYFLMLKVDGSVLHRFSYPSLERGKNRFPLNFSHTHLCKEDVYKCLFSLEGENIFSTHYKVKGPLKDYIIETQYIRK